MKDTQTTTVFAVIVVIALMGGLFLGVGALLWLAYNHGIADTFQIRRLGYWNFVALWVCVCVAIRILRGK